MKKLMMAGLVAAISGTGFGQAIIEPGSGLIPVQVEPLQMVPPTCPAIDSGTPAAIAVNNVRFLQRYPWNNLVDVDFDLSQSHLSDSNLVVRLSFSDDDSLIEANKFSIDDGKTWQTNCAGVVTGLVYTAEDLGAQHVHLVWEPNADEIPFERFSKLRLAVEVDAVPEPVSVTCENGTFVGQKSPTTGVVSFFGIPFAKPPVGALRWKRPEPPDATNAVFRADRYAAPSLQLPDKGELCSMLKTSENSLKLNVWTADTVTPLEKKAVFVYIHGGSFGWGGTADPFYDGRYLAEAYTNVIVVTVTYRLNAIGFLDLSVLPDGETYKASDFPDAPNLGVLDVQQSLRWINGNIEKFGGDPDRVTICGESAGGAMTSILLLNNDDGKGGQLFRRAIAMSGALHLTDPVKTFETNNQAWAMLDALHALHPDFPYTVDGLMMASSEDLLKMLNTKFSVLKHPHLDPPREGFGDSVACLNNFPMRDDTRGIVPFDAYNAITNFVKFKTHKVDLMVGSTAEDAQYWSYLMYDPEADDPFALAAAQVDRSNRMYVEAYEAVHGKGSFDTFLAGHVHPFDTNSTTRVGNHPDLWTKSQLNSTTSFHLPAVWMAENHEKARRLAGGESTGKTYMYLFGKAWESDEMPWLGACHSCELCYLFNNTVLPHNGPTDPVLAAKFSKAMMNFVCTGDPGDGWEEYATANGRKTMVVGNDKSMTVKDDPHKDWREGFMDILQDLELK